MKDRLIRQKWRPWGTSLFTLQLGLGFVLVIAAWVAILISQVLATSTTLATVLKTSAQAALAVSYASSAGGETIFDPTAFGQNWESTLANTARAGSVVGCHPIASDSAVCAGSETWFGVPVAPSLAQSGVLDAGWVVSGNTVSVTLAVMPPPMLGGIQIPITVTRTLTVDTGGPSGVVVNPLPTGANSAQPGSGGVYY